MRWNTGKKGFTLVELVVGLALISILIGAVSGLILSAFNTYGKNAQREEMKQIGNSIYYYYEEKLKIANKISYSEINGGTDNIKLTVSDEGYVLFNDIDITDDAVALNLLGDDFYHNNTVDVYTRIDDNGDYNYTMNLKIVVTYNEDGHTYTKESAFRLNTIKTKQVEILPADLGPAGDYRHNAPIYYIR